MALQLRAQAQVSVAFHVPMAPHQPAVSGHEATRALLYWPACHIQAWWVAQGPVALSQLTACTEGNGSSALGLGTEGVCVCVFSETYC